jgi:hypothetical protein
MMCCTAATNGRANDECWDAGMGDGRSRRCTHPRKPAGALHSGSRLYRSHSVTVTYRLRISLQHLSAASLLLFLCLQTLASSGLVVCCTASQRRRDDNAARKDNRRGLCVTGVARFFAVERPRLSHVPRAAPARVPPHAAPAGVGEWSVGKIGRPRPSFRNGPGTSRRAQKKESGKSDGEKRAEFFFNQNALAAQ